MIRVQGNKKTFRYQKSIFCVNYGISLSLSLSLSLSPLSHDLPTPLSIALDLASSPCVLNRSFFQLINQSIDRMVEESFKYVILISDISTVSIFHRARIHRETGACENGTSEEVKNIVSVLNAGEVPSQDVVDLCWIFIDVHNSSFMTKLVYVC
ncbi:hypothetical protein HYC85_021832 [Camellia sinensis]|uniref:Uncharacterized protein n=1 Tax=Camellia sinensis TaxID=4442 RepID=A0A7J7GK98_CAMSI|nr:hypothetical protein HYC85_021832 [Camellia sinensis]